MQNNTFKKYKITFLELLNASIASCLINLSLIKQTHLFIVHIKKIRLIFKVGINVENRLLSVLT